MRRTIYVECLKRVEPTYAMVDMHHEITLGQASRLREKIIGASLAGPTGHSIAQNILLANDGDQIGFKPML